MATDTGRARIAVTLADHIAALAASGIGGGDMLVTLQPHNNRALHNAEIALRSQDWQTVLALLAYMLPLAPGLLATLAGGAPMRRRFTRFTTTTTPTSWGPWRGASEGTEATSFCPPCTQ